MPVEALYHKIGVELHFGCKIAKQLENLAVYVKEIRSFISKKLCIKPFTVETP